VVIVDGGACVLEIHVMQPYGQRLHEVRRDDTEPVLISGIRGRVAQVAAEHGCRYATISRAEKDWPPEWTDVALATTTSR